MKEVCGVALKFLCISDREHQQYFRDIDATRKAFKNGYFNTGDLAVMYPDGTIYVVDRSKDIIISGGEVRSSYSIVDYI